MALLNLPKLDITVLVVYGRELKDYFDDLKTWRAESARAQTLDFSLLDRNNGAGWDLACKLVRRRNDFLR